MKIGILGVGGIGGVIGGFLARAGHDITLIDTWPENIERIKSDGLTVSTIEEQFTVQPNTLHLGELSMTSTGFDSVLLAVKSYDTAWASMFIKPHMAPRGYIVSAQNSINEDIIAQIVGWPRVLGCVITIGAAMDQPGHARRTSANSKDRVAFTVGEPSGIKSVRLKELARLFEDVGTTKITSNLWGQRWSKLCTNCMTNSIAGFTGLTSAEVKQNPEARWLSIRVSAELVNVATSLGITVEPIVGIEAYKFEESLTNRTVREEVENMISGSAKAVGTGKPSLAQDIAKGRKTEVDSLNGYVVLKGNEVGVPTPVNKAIVDFTKRVEAGEVQPSLSNLETLG